MKTIKWMEDPICPEWFVSSANRFWVYETRPGVWRAVDVLHKRPVSATPFSTAENAKFACEAYAGMRPPIPGESDGKVE